MIDFDIYVPSPRVENFLQLLRIKLNKDYPTTNVYISSAGYNDNWIRKVSNNTELMEG
jgi:hypothetical protein